MQDAGLEIRYDAFGNLFGSRRGMDPKTNPVVTGSHVDGPPNSEIYDGWLACSPAWKRAGCCRNVALALNLRSKW